MAKLKDQHNGPHYKLMMQNSKRKSNLLSPYPFSVSKINIAISLFIVFIWTFLITFSIKEFIEDEYNDIKFFLALTAFFVIFIYFLVFKMDSSKNVEKSDFINRVEN